jgi:hypothetical protein
MDDQPLILILGTPHPLFIPKRIEADRRRAFVLVYDALAAHGSVLAAEPDEAGRIDVRCPWAGEHHSADTQRAWIDEPAERNGYRGGFRCASAYCGRRGWNELVRHVATRHDESAALLRASVAEDLG